MTPAGEVWADLNAAGSYKFSDADFPAILGWDCIADDTATEDQRCDSAKLKALLLSEISDPAEKQRLLQNNDPMQMFAQVRKAGIAQKLRRAICKFPSEFDQGTFENRYGHIAREQYFQENPKNWDKLKAHIKALTFTDLPEAYKAAQWHFEPVEFIKQMRRCMWLSKSELKQMVPIKVIRHQKYKPNRSSPLEHRYHWEAVNFSGASALIDAQCVPLNRMMRKFGITTPKRQASFLGNAIQETTWLSTLQEGSPTGYWYAPWFGRGFLQLTHAENYIEYWRWIGRSVPESLKTALKNAAAQTHSANSNAGLQDSHFPALTQKMRDWRDDVMRPGKADAANSAGFYWSMLSVNRNADGGHILERQTVPQFAAPHATLSFYRSVSFWEACAKVNLPGAVNNPWSLSLNGFVDRCCAYAQVLMVVSEVQFPTARGLSLLPETLTQRRV